MSSYRQWLEALGNVPTARCPQCAGRSLDLLFVGNASTRVGTGILWCHACRHGVRLAKAKAPPNVFVCSFADAAPILETLGDVRFVEEARNQ